MLNKIQTQEISELDFLSKKRKGNKAQMGETMTWVVATLVIIILLSISIYAATMFAKTRIVNYADVSSFSENNLKSYDILMDKSLFAYFISSEDSGKNILENLNKMDNSKLFYADFNLRFEELKGEIGK